MFGTDAAQSLLASAFAPWVQALDLSVQNVDAEGGVTVSMPITDNVARMGGIVCGQALAALADTTMVLSTAAHFGGLRETVQNFVPWRISLRHWEAVFEHDCELAFDCVPFAH